MIPLLQLFIIAQLSQLHPNAYSTVPCQQSPSVHDCSHDGQGHPLGLHFGEICCSVQKL